MLSLQHTSLASFGHFVLARSRIATVRLQVLRSMARVQAEMQASARMAQICDMAVNRRVPQAVHLALTEHAARDTPPSPSRRPASPSKAPAVYGSPGKAWQIMSAGEAAGRAPPPLALPLPGATLGASDRQALVEALIRRNAELVKTL